MGIETGFSKAAKKEQTKEIARLKEERFRIIWENSIAVNDAIGYVKTTG